MSLIKSVPLLILLATIQAAAQPTAPRAVIGPTFVNIGLAWDANPETDLAGYKVYWGTATRQYGTPIQVSGTPTSPAFTLTGFAGGTYFFAVTAYNTSGLESGFSNEVSATILPNPPPPTVGPTGPMGPVGPPGPAYDPGPIPVLVVTSITTTTATFAWSTKDSCSGIVYYGTAEPLTRYVKANNLGTVDHLAVVTGLITKTHYLYKVTGVCGPLAPNSGTTIESAVRSFNTK